MRTPSKTLFLSLLLAMAFNPSVMRAEDASAEAPTKAEKREAAKKAREERKLIEQKRKAAIEREAKAQAEIKAAEKAAEKATAEAKQKAERAAKKEEMREAKREAEKAPTKPSKVIPAPPPKLTAMPRNYTLKEREAGTAYRMKRFFGDKRVGTLTDEVEQSLREACERYNREALELIEHATKRNAELFASVEAKLRALMSASQVAADDAPEIQVPKLAVEVALTLAIRNSREWTPAFIDRMGVLKLRWFDSLQEATGCGTEPLRTFLDEVRSDLMNDNPQQIYTKENALKKARQASAKQVLTPEQYEVFLEVHSEVNNNLHRFLADKDVLKALKQMKLDSATEARVNEILDEADASTETQFIRLIEVLSAANGEILVDKLRKAQKHQEATEKRKRVERAKRKKADNEAKKKAQTKAVKS